MACGAQYSEDGAPAATTAAVNPAADVAPVPPSAAAASSPALVLHVNGSAPRAQSEASGLVRRRRSDEDEDDSDDDEGAPQGRAAPQHSTSSLSSSSSSSSSPAPAAASGSSPSPVPSDTGAAASASDVSSRLSEKLLQGWTMLAQECPNPACSCPLMRKKDGPRVCVQCGSTVVTQEEKEQMDRLPSAGKQSASTSSTSPQRADGRRATPASAKGRRKTAFEGHPAASDEDASDAGGRGEAAKEEDSVSDRLSSLNSASLVHSLSHSPLVRRSGGRPSAISSAPKYTSPALIDASPSTRTPPSTPALFPFASPLPSSTQLSASISSAFSQHPVYPPPGHMSRVNSQASDYSAFPQHNVGLGSLSFAQPPATLPVARQLQHTPGGNNGKGKFSFRPSSAAASVAPAEGAGGGAMPLLAVPTPLPAGAGAEGAGGGTPVTSAGGSPLQGNGSGATASSALIVQGSVDALYVKLDGLRALLSSCGNVEQTTLIAVAMREISHALRALHGL